MTTISTIRVCADWIKEELLQISTIAEIDKIRFIRRAFEVFEKIHSAWVYKCYFMKNNRLISYGNVGNPVFVFEDTWVSYRILLKNSRECTETLIFSLQRPLILQLGWASLVLTPETQFDGAILCIWHIVEYQKRPKYVFTLLLV